MQHLLFPRPPLVTGNFSGVEAIDWSRNPIVTSPLTGNVEIYFSVDPPYPCPLYWVVTQDGTGGHTIDWSHITLSGPEPVISTLANTTTVIYLFWDGTSYNV